MYGCLPNLNLHHSKDRTLAQKSQRVIVSLTMLRWEVVCHLQASAILLDHRVGTFTGRRRSSSSC